MNGRYPEVTFHVRSDNRWLVKKTFNASLKGRPKQADTVVFEVSQIRVFLFSADPACAQLCRGN
jgi:hypothetical protein